MDQGIPVKKLVALDAPTVTAAHSAVRHAAKMGYVEMVSNYYDLRAYGGYMEVSGVTNFDFSGLTQFSHFFITKPAITDPDVRVGNC